MIIQRFFSKILKIFFSSNEYRYIYSLVLKYSTFNQLISATFRVLFRYNSLFLYYYSQRKSINLKTLDSFWIIRIGYVKKRNYPIFINVDPFISNKPTICTNVIKLSCFGKYSCQEIHFKHFLEYIPEKKYHKVLQLWKKILIPGGLIQLQFKIKNPKSLSREIEEFKALLLLNDYYIKEIDDYNLEINGTITLRAVNEKVEKKIFSITELDMIKIKDIHKILYQNRELFANHNKIGIITSEISKIESSTITNRFSQKIQFFEKIDSLIPISEDDFDFFIVINYLEHINYSINKQLFNELKRITKDNAPILIIVPERLNYLAIESKQIFNKGIFLKLIDDLNINAEWMCLSSSFKMIQIFLKNKNNFPIEKNGIKVLLIGNYDLRYNFLNNARWDSQARAFEKLGYLVKIIDIRNNSFDYIIKFIEKFNPDYVWTGGVLVNDFLRQYYKFFRNSKLKVVYWFWELRPIIEFNFKDIIDCMFISSQSEVPLYKKKYNIERVFFMPAAIIPEALCWNRSIEEEYDIGFAGSLDYKFHRERTSIIDFIKKKYNIKIFKDLYTTLPEHYSKCKIVLGGSPTHKEQKFYCSNRIFVATSCGSCFITNYFNGLEKLAKNGKHLLWFHNFNDLELLLNKYLSDNNLRYKIKNNAEKWARKYHNYELRIQNCLDIVNGKTESFYGILE